MENSLEIEVKEISYLRPDPNNARKHDAKNIDAIAKSLERFGQRKPIVIRGDGTIVAGNGTVEAAKQLGWTEIACARVPWKWTAGEVNAYALADNRTAELAEWDSTILAEQLLELDAVGWDIADLGFESLEVPTYFDEDEAPLEFKHEAVSQLGDIWLLGSHRVMCGDSTNKDHVAKLTDGKKAILLHADPPYGMGKENQGVQNDNLYAEKLDAFQMLWWKTWRKHLQDNGSAYIWGNPEDLWRLWYLGGLKDSERLTMRNEIVWAKPAGFAQTSEILRSYPINTERILFFMLGEQGFNNNSDNYWDGWENIRSYLNDEMEKCGGRANWKNALGNHMGHHYFTKSQWVFPTKEAYAKLQSFGRGDSFKRDYDSLKRDYDSLKREFYATRAFFDNAHDNMNEVWNLNKVSGNDRFGHATPKPVELMRRVMKSSAPEQGLVFEPFGGSGSTLIGAEQTNRICYTMEMTPAYVDLTVKRWENLTGQTAELLKA